MSDRLIVRRGYIKSKDKTNRKQTNKQTKTKACTKIESLINGEGRQFNQP